MDKNKLNKLRQEQRRILGLLTDDDIDYSDAPPTDEKFWKDAVIHHDAKVRASVERGLEQAAEGRGVYMGSFAEFVDDEKSFSSSYKINIYYLI